MYKKALRDLLTKDGMCSSNIEIALSWFSKYPALSIGGALNRKAFDSIISKRPDCLISYIFKGVEFGGDTFIKASNYFIALMKKPNSSYESYTIYYVS